MSNGDAAAAVGMDTVPGTADLRDSYDEHNKTRDYLAAHQTGGTHPASAINSGVLGEARIPDLPASKIDSGTFDSDRIPNLPASKITSGTISRPVSTSGGGRFGDAWNNNIVTTRRSVWMESNGQLGHTASSERYKTAIRRAETDPVTILEALEVVYYEPRMTAEQLADRGGRAPTEVGVIAERLAEAGLWEFVFTNADGVMEGVHYELLSLAALVAVQHVWGEHKSLADRVDALEKGAS